MATSALDTPETTDDSVPIPQELDEIATVLWDQEIMRSVQMADGSVRPPQPGRECLVLTRNTIGTQLVVHLWAKDNQVIIPSSPTYDDSLTQLADVLNARCRNLTWSAASWFENVDSTDSDSTTSHACAMAEFAALDHEYLFALDLLISDEHYWSSEGFPLQRSVTEELVDYARENFDSVCVPRTPDLRKQEIAPTDESLGLHAALYFWETIDHLQWCDGLRTAGQADLELDMMRVIADAELPFDAETQGVTAELIRSWCAGIPVFTEIYGN